MNNKLMIFIIILLVVLSIIGIKYLSIIINYDSDSQKYFPITEEEKNFILNFYYYKKVPNEKQTEKIFNQLEGKIDLSKKTIDMLEVYRVARKYYKDDFEVIEYKHPNFLVNKFYTISLNFSNGYKKTLLIENINNKKVVFSENNYND